MEKKTGRKEVKTQERKEEGKERQKEKVEEGRKVIMKERNVLFVRVIFWIHWSFSHANGLALRPP